MIRVLYAEDNDGMRKMVSHFLTNADFAVFAVTDGDEAIKAAHEDNYDVILLDVTMERVDGIQAAREIRNKCPLNFATPIVGLTGRTETSEIEECRKSGMEIVLAKPVDLENLALTLASDIRALKSELESDAPNQIITPSVKVIDVDVLQHYAKVAGRCSLEGILRDFSDLWPRKIGELYSAIVSTDTDAFARAGEELAAIAAGIGAGKVAQYAAQALGATDVQSRENILPLIVQSCNEVQAIINAVGQGKSENIELAA